MQKFQYHIGYFNEAGQYHRTDGPAIEYFAGPLKGYKAWYLDGQRHREGGPAVESSEGEKHWYRNGQLHRENGPALESPTYRAWFLNNHRHREDGPAREWSDGRKEYWLHGKRILTEEDRKIEEMKRRNAESLIKENASPLI